MKKVIGLALMFMAAGVSANQTTADFTTNINSFCAVGQLTPGTMHVNGTSISTDTPAVVQVNNNEAATYKISAANAGDFTGKPNGYTGTAAMTTSLVIAGSNPGTVAPGAEHNLDNVGADTVNVSVDGSTDVEAIAGNYAASAIVSCIAQ